MIADCQPFWVCLDIEKTTPSLTRTLVCDEKIAKHKRTPVCYAYEKLYSARSYGFEYGRYQGQKL